MDKTIERIERCTAVLVGVGALGGWGTGYLHGPSVLIGGGVMLANFWLLKKVVRAVFSHSREGHGGKARAAVWFGAKGLLILFLLSALFIRYPIQAGSFAVGVSLLLLACVIVSLSESRTGPSGAGPHKRLV